MKQKIFILHGWAYSTEKWQPILGLLKKQNIEPVMLEIPGLTVPLENVWKLEDYVAWLKNIVDKEKGKVILLGHSNGGRISIAFAAKYPEKVNQLFLIDSAGIYHNELPLRIKRSVFGFLAKTGKKISHSERLRKLLYRFARESDYEKVNPIVRQTMHNLITSDVSPSLLQIPASVTIIWGANDKITPLVDGEKMQTLLPNAELYIIKEGRHSPQFTQAKEVSEIVINNLK